MNYNIEDLANVFYDLLNGDMGKPKYKVFVNSATERAQVSVVMYPERVIPKNELLDYETVQVFFELYVDVTLEQDQLDFINEVTRKMLGVKRGTFTSNFKTYKYTSYLDFGLPRGAPEIDRGTLKALHVVQGNIFVTTEQGPIVSNATETFISLGGVEYFKLPINSQDVEHGVTVDGMPTGNKLKVEPVITAESRSVTLSFTLQERDTDKQLYRIIAGYEPGWADTNYVYLRETMPWPITGGEYKYQVVEIPDGTDLPIHTAGSVVYTGFTFNYETGVFTLTGQTTLAGKKTDDVFYENSVVTTGALIKMILLSDVPAHGFVDDGLEEVVSYFIPAGALKYRYTGGELHKEPGVFYQATIRLTEAN